MADLQSLAYFTISASASLVALRATQKFRPLLSIIILVFSFLSFRHLNGLGLSEDHSSVLGLFLLIWSSHVVCVLYLERFPPCPTWTSAYKMLFNARWIGTDREVTSGPETRPSTTDGGKQRPGKPQYAILLFVLHRLFSAAVIFALDYLYTEFFRIYQPLDYADFLPSKQEYFRRFDTVTMRETLTRMWIVFHFVWSAWVIFTGIHHLLAAVFVSLGLDEPEDWPQLYGSISQMYTIRRFWGKFWHRLVYRTNVAFGSLLSQKVLRLRAGGTMDRLLVNFMVFFISGAVHALVTLQLGFSCGYWEDVGWFSLNFVAMLAEQSVQNVVYRSRSLAKFLERSGAGRLFGLIWVFTFFFWSLPKTQYPKIVCN